MPRGGARPGAGRKPGKSNGSNQNNQTTPATADTKRPFFSNESVEAIIRAFEERQMAARNRPRTPDWNPYVIRPERFGPVAQHIQRHRPALAMDRVMGLDDSNQVAIQAWQAGGLLGNLVSEGLLFLGYPFLAELAQRPEFRLFGEIRAQEMTRKWIDYRPVQDESTKDKDAENKGKQRENPDDQARARERRANDEKPRTDDRNKEIEEKIKELDDAMEEFRVRDWFQDTAAQDSFFGISHLYVDIKGTDAENIRDPELPKSIGNGRDNVSRNKLTRGCLRSLRTIEPIWVYPTTYNAVNPLLESWYDPQVWYVMGSEIHKTRLLTFTGRPVPDILKPAYAFGGLSMTQMAQPYVDIWLRTRESVGQLIHAFSIMILQTNLGTTTMPGGAGSGGAGDILARLMLFNMLRDNQGVFAIDKNTEDFKNVSAPLSGLDELQAQSQEHMFSVGRIPAVKFAGIQPKGLNATSEGEMRAFYDTIIGEQNHLFRPNLTTVSDIVQIHLWGACDKDITYDFVPLWEQTEKEKAEIRKIDAETAQILIDSGQISQEEARRRLATDPESGYHEIDPDDVPDLLEEETEGLIPPGAGRGIEAELQEAEGEEVGGDGVLMDDDGLPLDDMRTKAQNRRDAIVTAGGKDRRQRARPFGRDSWNESEHPRVQGGEKGGQFTKGGGGGGSSKSETTARTSAEFKTKKDHAEHLLKKGVTTKEMLDALCWPSISMSAMAKSLNMRLEKVKEGKVTRYKGVSLGPREQPEKTHSLLPFLAKRGGIRQDDGNISDVRAAIGKNNKFLPGFGQLIRTPKKLSTAAQKGGAYAPMDLDQAREAAAEAGYIPENITLAEFIDAIDSELRGQHVYPAGYLPEGRSPDPDELEHQQNGFMAELHNISGELSATENIRAVELWTHEGINDPLDVLERIAIEADDGEVSAGAPKRSEPIPGWDDDGSAIPF